MAQTGPYEEFRTCVLIWTLGQWDCGNQWTPWPDLNSWLHWNMNQWTIERWVLAGSGERKHVSSRGVPSVVVELDCQSSALFHVWVQWRWTTCTSGHTHTHTHGENQPGSFLGHFKHFCFFGYVELGEGGNSTWWKSTRVILGHFKLLFFWVCWVAPAPPELNMSTYRHAHTDWWWLRPF